MFSAEMAVSSMGDVMTNSGTRADIHSIATIPDADRIRPGRSRCGFGAGANIRAVNWALGALDHPEAWSVGKPSASS